MTKCVFCCEKISWDTLICPKCNREQQPRYWRHILTLKPKLNKIKGKMAIFRDNADYHILTQKKRNKDAEETALIDRLIDKALFNRRLKWVMKNGST